MKIPMRRRPRKGRHTSIITYDLESTRIAEGLPTPLYISWADSPEATGLPLNGLSDLHDVLVTFFLTDENRKKRFVAHNGNKFDAQLIVHAMLGDSKYTIEPWLTNGGNFRGMAISLTDNPKHRWIFSDSIAMFGLIVSLREFLTKFAIEQAKLSIDVLNFDNTNPEHIEYAKNDSSALWVAVNNASQHVHNATGIWPSNTIGKTAIQYFESQIPENVNIWEVPYSASKWLERTKRGGYVYCAGSYRGQIWKYDRNQAYAASMREKLPSGRCIRTSTYKQDKLGFYKAIIYRKDYSPIPFYMRGDDGRPSYTHSGFADGYILSIEVEYLRSHGWNVEILEGWYWTDTFTMSDMVNNLEHCRMTCEGGPKGALGIIYKMIGNNAFGKTWEEHDGIRIVYANEPKEGYRQYRAEDPNFDHVWIYREEPRKETYHKPQIGTFITAYQRINLMEQAWIAPHQFLYADTDCIVFTKEVTALLDIDDGRYGAYKVEALGAEYGFINKKVYYSLETIDGITPKVASAKGIHSKELTLSIFEGWYNGILPVQQQVQRQNLKQSIGTGKMFLNRKRTGSFLLPRLE